MYRDASIAVVMPAYNVEAHVRAAVETVPAFVEHVVVVDDASVDGTAASLDGLARDGLLLVRHARNRGVGAAISSGYRRAVACGADVVVVMAGDGQMDPGDLPALLDPVVEGRADYAKGNRFRHADIAVMPRARRVGNVALSLLTKVTSGYARIFDSQCGYTAITRGALERLDGELFARYGYPNDLLARLGGIGARVVDVPVRPIYDGQASGIRWWTVIYPILFVLARSMVRRLWVSRRRRLRGGALAAPLCPDADRAADHLLPAPRR